MSVYTFTAGLVGGGTGQALLHTNLATLSQAVILASPARVFSMWSENTGGGMRWLQLHNVVGVIPALAVPLLAFKVDANVILNVGNGFFGAPVVSGSTVKGGVQFPIGLSWGWSSTLAVFTAAVPTGVVFVTYSNL